MSNLKSNLAQLEHYGREIEKALTSQVAVGLPKEKITGSAYKNGADIATIGAAHEFGVGNLPMRSWLREPFQIKGAELSAAIARGWDSVFTGRTTANQALGILGVQAVEISQSAFDTGGFGRWPDVSDYYQQNVKGAGKTKTLVDSGTLRNSITWVIR